MIFMVLLIIIINKLKMEAINSFRELFLEVWNQGVFGLNALILL